MLPNVSLLSIDHVQFGLKAKTKKSMADWILRQNNHQLPNSTFIPKINYYFNILVWCQCHFKSLKRKKQNICCHLTNYRSPKRSHINFFPPSFSKTAITSYFSLVFAKIRSYLLSCYLGKTGETIMCERTNASGLWRKYKKKPKNIKEFPSNSLLAIWLRPPPLRRVIGSSPAQCVGMSH